jgi:hypothetical protein
MEDLNELAIFSHSIIDENRGVDQLTNTRQSGDQTPDVREASEQVNMD